MKTLITLALCLLLVSCNDKKPTGPLPFFHFDEIDYYHIGISEEEATEMSIKQDKTRKEQALLQIINGNVPVNTRDTLFINNMDILRFEKHDIDPKFNPQFADLFRVRENVKPEAVSCISVYRDVLVFRQKDKVVGVAKICFDCGTDEIVGSRYDTSTFGEGGDYEKLEALLKQAK
ncbi:hypothetical protein [Flavobacterium sp.]|uniref:hypothetical protein n=1 Tax=Flavobacterium sp. TaxID=239 RepID=UPI0039E71EE0